MLIPPGSGVLDFPVDESVARRVHAQPDPSDPRIEALISRQAARAPGDPAAISDAGILTFDELERLSDRLAQSLVRVGVVTGDYVMVSLERDHAFLVAILATLKVGAAFIPVELPEAQARIARLADMPGVGWVLADLACVDAFEETGLKIVLVELSALRDGRCDEGPPEPLGDAADIAYGIATSGSSGVPKTVIVAHRQVRRLFAWIGETFGIGPGDIGLWVSPAAFDLSIFDLLGLPSLGACVRMLSRRDRADPAASAGVLLDEPITFWNSTPSLLQAVLPFLRKAERNLSRASLRVVFVSGDWVPLSLYAGLKEVFPNAKLVALGGATEATIWSNYHVVDGVDRTWASIPYGRPIPHARYHVLDEAGRPCQADERGELFIGGDCLALGYLGDDELTRARFVPDPFSDVPDARMYRTGDAARLWPDGTIELLGRMDRQVNISGYRVDLGEVETALKRSGLSNAAAIAVPNVAGTLRLEAAGIPQHAETSVHDVMERIRQFLPPHMIPNRLVLLEHFPLTNNGKVDHAALAAILREETAPTEPGNRPVALRAAAKRNGGAAAEAAATIEAFLRKEIAAIVGDAVEGFDRDQPLGDVGLNSLGFAVLSGRIFEAFSLKVSPVDFYAAGTLKAMVARLAGMQPPDTGLEVAPASAINDLDPAGFAIVGMSCRFPGADDLDAFWANLVAGRESIRRIPDERARAAGVAPAELLPGGYLDHVDGFDAKRFGITPKEADHMDPRQCLLLEAVRTAIEHAGEKVESLKGERVGVFVGATGDDFSRLSFRDPAAIQGHTLTGISPAILANRISYVFDLKGPSEVIDTACSSSLVALHRALTALAQGECDAAIVAGVSLMLDPATNLALDRIGMLSADGKCKAFDARADGYGRGEGVGVVYLKSVSRARDAGNRIHCRILGSAANHGGRTTSLTAPSPEAQCDVIRRCHERAGIDPATVGMIEAHGTGTALGDPIETRALISAFMGERRDSAAQPAGPHCALTAVKTNIGHLEAASGIAGLIKAALALEHAIVPPLANFERANELLGLDGSPFFLCTHACDWPIGGDAPRRAGVSAFGFGGANVHVVLEAGPEVSCRVADSGSDRMAFDAREAGIIAAHRISGRVVVPAAVWIGLYQRIFHRLTGAWPVRITKVRFSSNIGAEVPDAVACNWSRVETGWDIVLSDFRSGAVFTRARLHGGSDMPASPRDDTPDLEVDSRVLDDGQCYARLAAAGVTLGEPLRVIRRMTVADRWCRAELAGGSCPVDGRVDPALVDGALQAAALWDMEIHGPVGLCVPVAIGSVAIGSPLRSEAQATLSPAIDAKAMARSIDLTVADPDGRVCVRIDGLTAVAVAERAGAGKAHIFARDVQVVVPDIGRAGRADGGFGSEPVVVEIGAADWREDVRKVVASLRPAANRSPAAPLHLVVPYLLAAGAADVPAPGPAFGALARTLRLEIPGLHMTALGISRTPADGGAAEVVADAVRTLLRSRCTASELMFDPTDGRLTMPVLAPVPAAADAGVPIFRHRGVYIITGGAGAVGSALAHSLMSEYDAQVLLCGRSPADHPKVRERLAVLADVGGKVHYLSADVTRAEDARRLAGTARALSGTIAGIVHCAGVLDDRLFTALSEADILAVVDPKLSGAVNLHHATVADELDFFVLCSSLVATSGNVGQSAYALANGCLESFATWREQARGAGQCEGQTSAIAWGPWRTSDGMQIAAHRRERLAHRNGLGEIAAEDGLAVLRQALAARRQVVVAAAGDGAKLSAWLSGTLSAVPEPMEAAALAPAVAGADAAFDRATEIVIAAIVEESGLSRADIDPSARFEDFGLDSALIVGVTERLEQQFGEMPVTVFFEHRTVAELAAYVARTHADMLLAEADARRAERPGGLDEGPAVAESPPVPADDGSRISEDVVIYGPRDIAIIGMAGRFPAAGDLRGFWHNLVDGRDCIEEVPVDRWDWRQYGGDDDPGRWGGFIDGWDCFDYGFFAIAPAEAEMMDPQERVFLQCVYHALEDAGYPRPRVAGQAIGVYAGVMWGQYQLYGVDSVNASTSYGSIAHRVSHVFDLSGPSIGLDTMCSSSLTAVHLACESLRKGETRLAIAGGVNLDVHPNKHRFLVKRHFAASDGRCRAFGSGGDGYVPGEGVAALVLKPMADALADGDRIHGVIKGTAVNHGGRTRGYTVPNPTAQAEVIAAAIADADIAAGTISYVEAHGTGTALGDPIEVKALMDALGTHGPRCPIGSVKSNIGHLESAAGAASLVKVLLQMRHRMLVPSIHADPPNEYIAFEGLPLCVQRTNDLWFAPLSGDTVRPQPRRAGISSFGAGGANAHVIVEEPPSRLPVAIGDGTEWLVVLSARDAERLGTHAANLLAWVQDMDAGLPADCDIARLQELLTGRVAEAVGRPADALDPNDTFAGLGFDDDLPATIARSFGVIWREAGAARHSISEFATALGSALRERPPRYSIADVSYTSLVGREPLDERLAIVARSLEDLAGQLAAYLDGAADDVLRGSRRRSSSKASGADAGALSDIFAARDWYKLARLWCDGEAIDWREMFMKGEARLTDQPGYPFAETRCWAAGGFVLGADGSGGAQMQAAEYAVTLPAERSPARRAARLLAALTSLDGHPRASCHLGPLTIRCRDSLPDDVTVRVTRSDGHHAGLQVCAPGRDEPVVSAVVLPDSHKIARPDPELRSFLDGVREGDEEQDDGVLDLRASTSEHAVLATFRHLAGGPRDQLVALFGFVFEAARRLDHAGNPCVVEMDEYWFAGHAVRHGRLVVARSRDGNLDCLIAQDGDPVMVMKNLRVAQQADSAPARIARPALGRIAFETTYVQIAPDHAGLAELGPGLPLVIDTHPDGIATAPGGHLFRPAAGGESRGDRKTFDPASASSIAACLTATAGADTVVFVAPRGHLAMRHAEAAIGAFCRLAEVLKDAGHGITRLILLTESGHGVDARERVNPHAALFLGLGRAAVRELARMDVRLVDVGEGDVARLIATGIEALPIPNQAREYILRDGLAYERRIKRAGQLSAYPMCYRRNGTYVLVGGSGAVGQAVTRYLVEHYDAHVAWIGRRSETVMRTSLDAPVPPGVVYYQADVCDSVALAEALDDIESRWGRLDGVLHMGLDFEFRRLADASAEDALRLLKAKVQGSRILLEEMRARAPGFVGLMSSAEVLAGNAGWGFYAGGCAYQDAIARDAARNGDFPIRVVNWGFWEGNKRGNPATLAARGVTPLSPEVGMHALSAAIHDERTQLFVFDVSAEALERLGLVEEERRDFGAKKTSVGTMPVSRLPAAPRSDGRAQPSAPPTTAPVQPRRGDEGGVPATWTLESVETELADALARTLGLSGERIDPDADLAEYGLDSILFLDFAEAVEKQFGRLRVDDLIALDTLRAMSTYVLDTRRAVPEAAGTQAAGDPLPAPQPAAEVEPEVHANDDIVVLAVAPAHESARLLLAYADEAVDEPPERPLAMASDAAADGFRHCLVRLSPSANVEVMICGQGPTLLLIPGIGLTAPVFHAQFAALAGSWRVIAIHSPGHGRSSPPAKATTEALAETIAATLRKLGVVEPVHVVASCFSTVAAQYLAAHRPELVASLTLCGASMEGVAVPAIPPEGLSAKDVARLTEMASKSLVADFEALTQAPQNVHVKDEIDACCRLLLRSQKASPSVGMKYLNEVLGLKPSEWAPRISAPTLFVVGALDTVVPPESTFATAPRIRNARVLEIANAGHYPFLTHPSVFNSGLEEFLRSLE
jgi:amino acid adenylation domain-containing protein